MSNKKKTPDDNTPKNGRRKAPSTAFKPGNTIGSETRFKPGHTLSTKYEEDYPDKLLEYFADCGEDVFPTVEGFAIKNHIAVNTVRNWANGNGKYPQFEFAYAQCIAMQKQNLLANGLLERYNAQLTKFLLINNHGMSEKVEQDNNVTISVKIDDDIADECD